MAASKKLKTIIFTNPDGSISEAILFPGFGGNGVAEVAARSDHSHTADNVAETAFKLWLTPTLQAAFNDKYTKLEIDNLISGIVHNMDWKESVDTYADIATTYPTPDDGWTVNARLEDGGNGKTYRYSAAKAAWVDVTGGIVPMATALQDGKLSKEDFIKLQGLVSFPGFAGSGIAETASRSDHGHSAAQVTFSDSKTLQQKLDAGELKGADGYTPIVGENSNWWVNGVDTGKKAVGADGKKILMQKNTIASTIEWQYEGDLVWQTLCAFADIQGPKGADGIIDINQNVQYYDRFLSSQTILVKKNITIYKETTPNGSAVSLTLTLEDSAASLNKCATIELHVNCTDYPNRTISFTNTITWIRNINVVQNIMVFTLRTFDAGQTWIADLSHTY